MLDTFSKIKHVLRKTFTIWFDFHWRCLFQRVQLNILGPKIGENPILVPIMTEFSDTGIQCGREITNLSNLSKVYGEPLFAFSQNPVAIFVVAGGTTSRRYGGVTSDDRLVFGVSGVSDRLWNRCFFVFVFNIPYYMLFYGVFRTIILRKFSGDLTNQIFISYFWTYSWLCIIVRGLPNGTEVRTGFMFIIFFFSHIRCFNLNEWWS